MKDQIHNRIAGELTLTLAQVQTVAELLADGATVPFIARYRKERTGSLDEVQIADIRDAITRYTELEKRRKTILASLEERGLLTDELQTAVAGAPTLVELEDIYLPFRPKRRTRAQIAREKGLEPLARLIFAQEADTDPRREAGAYLSEEHGIADPEEALAGARDIIAEWLNEDAELRKGMRKLFATRSTLASRAVEEHPADDAQTYRDYFDWQEDVRKSPSHRILAMFRGEREGHLRLNIRPLEEGALHVLRRLRVRGDSPAASQVDQALVDAYRRLLAPSLENELRGELKQRADEEAIRVFAANLRTLLMAAPLGQKSLLAIDPGLRTGCKVVCLDAQGALLDHTAVFPHTGKAKDAARILGELLERHDLEIIAIGNGTAGRETEAFVRAQGWSQPVVMVDESGASIYSASEVARREFPDHDVTVRGAISIGRRLQDPLAELVKIDPRSIGVGQYQHDVDQKHLRACLDDVVTSCVNGVGVNVNTASSQLLQYVSGLGPGLAAAIVTWRGLHGPFRTRRELLDVPRMGPKAFEQAGGFLRIPDAGNPLDASAVHPERYDLVQRIVADLDCSVQELMQQEELRSRIDFNQYFDDATGAETLRDIVAELARPGRDPRESFEIFAFAEGVADIKDLEIGMELPGIVTNVTAFGAFVDVGVHTDGLVHISQLADRFVRDPAEVVRVQQKVKVRVTEVDLKRKRIGLSMRSKAAE